MGAATTTTTRTVGVRTRSSGAEPLPASPLSPAAARDAAPAGTAAAAEAEAAGADDRFPRLTKVKRRLSKASNTIKNEIVMVETVLRNDLRMVLGRIEAAEEFMKFNTFIHGGYRLQVQHYSECLVSMFMLHNETVNIWSHIFGLAAIAYAFVDAMNRFYPFASTVDLLIFVGFFIGASTMFFMSAMYHTFMCHSFSVFSYVMTWDYVGIFFMIFGSTLSATHVLFYCFDGWRQFYQLAFGTMCALGAVCVGLPYFQDDAHRPIKVAIYGGLVFMAVLPIFHAGLIYDLSITANWVIQLLLYGSGVVVYVVRFPEAWFPGKFDYIGASHQLWHLLIVAAGLWHYHSLIEVYQERLDVPCIVA